MMNMYGLVKRGGLRIEAVICRPCRVSVIGDPCLLKDLLNEPWASHPGRVSLLQFFRAHRSHSDEELGWFEVICFPHTQAEAMAVLQQRVADELMKAPMTGEETI